MQRSLGIVCLLALACAKDEPLRRFDYQARKMATPVQLVFYARSDSAAEDAARATFARIEELDSLLSDYRTASEVAIVESQQPGTAIRVSADFATVAAAAQNMSRATEGAFDMTVGPLSQLWRNARRRDTIPDARSICAAAKLVGWRSVTLDPAARTIRFDRAGMRLDFGGIAKGYAADAALEALRSRGITRALVVFGGEIRAGDAPPEETGWPVSVDGLASPEMLANAALSTSGDAWQFIEIGGVRYSHVVDPRSGWALTSRINATVRAPSATLADALATSVTVLDSASAAAVVSAHAGAELLTRAEEPSHETAARSRCS